MKKRITYKEWTEIGKYNYAAKWLRRICSYTLIKESDTQFKREQRVGLIMYIIIFIPICLAQFFYCIWDGGLKEYEWPERYLGGDWLSSGSSAFDTAQQIWNNC